MLGCFEQRFSKSFGFRSKWLKLFWKLKILELEVWALTHPPPTKTLSFHNQNQLFFFLFSFWKKFVFLSVTLLLITMKQSVFFFFFFLPDLNNTETRARNKKHNRCHSIHLFGWSAWKIFVRFFFCRNHFGCVGFYFLLIYFWEKKWSKSIAFLFSFMNDSKWCSCNRMTS